MKRIKARRSIVVWLGIAVVVSAVIWVVFCGNPQWNRYVYLLQWKVYNQQPSVPCGFTGIWREWYPSGKLYRTARYVDGHWQGSFEEWDESGVMRHESVQEGDASFETHYDEAGNREAELKNYRDGDKWVKVYRKFVSNDLVSTRARTFDEDNNLITDTLNPTPNPKDNPNEKQDSDKDKDKGNKGGE